MLRTLIRYAFQGVQYSSALIANRNTPWSNSHDLLKAKWMSLSIEDGSRVLDIGCGNGRRLMELSLFVNCLEGVGVEIRPSVTPQAVVPGTSIPELKVFDGKALPFEDKSFDVSTCCYVLHHLKEAHALSLLEDAIRVSRRRILILEDSRPTFSPAYRVRNWAHATEANLGYEEGSKYFEKNFDHVMFKTHGEWQKLLASLDGVKDVTCVPLDSISQYKHHTLFIVEI